MEVIKTKFRAGTYLIPVLMTHKDGRIYLSFPYNKILVTEMKAFDGSRWDPESKCWHIPDNQRNRFQLQYLMGQNPYARYDVPDVEVVSKRPLYKHQKEMVSHGLTRHYCILACDMGTGKTLSAIEIMESIEGLQNHEVYYVGPKSGVRAVELELLKWESRIWPKMLTYEGLVKEMKNWPDGKKAPRVVIFDESSKIKTPTSQRSQAAMALADGVRHDWGDQGYIFLLSGTPAPRSPVDWWHQCLADDTWITTTQGLRQIKDLINVSFEATVQGRVAHSNGFFKTGTKQLYKVTTKQGYKIRCTEEEKFLVDYDGLQMWKSLSELSVGDSLVVSDCGNREWDGFGSYTDGYLIGQLIGDGWVDTRDIGTSVVTYGHLQLCNPDFGLIPFIKEILPDAKFSRTKKSYRVSSKYLTGLILALNLDKNKYLMDSLIKKSSSAFLKGLASGLFDSDGTADKEKLVIEFCSINITTVNKLQLILNCLGIKSSIRKRINKVKEICGVKCTAEPLYYLLTIRNDDAIKFNNTVGFNHPEKRAKLLKTIGHRHAIYSPKVSTEIESIEKDIVEDVYDCEVQDIHMFTANGLVVHNCEVACPGFLKEGNIFKFKNRLAIVEERENILTGGKFPYLIAWRDNENRCECGKMKDDECHDVVHHMGDSNFHPFKGCKNEVGLLYDRMKGLVLVRLKKDCLDLPDKQYRIVQLKPNVDTLRVAKMIKQSAGRAIEALTLLRELSDGFQYKELETGQYMTCPRCNGTGKVFIPVPKETIDPAMPTREINESMFEKKEMPCDNCMGTGQAMTYTRGMDQVPCPKDDQLREDLDAHEDIGRLIVWAAFTGTIDKLVELCKHEGWSVLRIDGRGYIATDSDGKILDDRECLMAMDAGHPRSREFLEKYPKLVVVAHPKAGGMALTLTASPTEIFYSNDFSGEGRMQAEDRAHRPGMDTNKGLTIVDYIHLPSDQYVLDNLKKKKDLQKISMGELNDMFNSMEANNVSQVAKEEKKNEA